MLEDQIVLWKHRLMKDVEAGNNRSINPDEIMHESLSGLGLFASSTEQVLKNAQYRL